MPTYFKPLRRKIGMGMLTFACVLMVGWLRSYQFDDMIRFKALCRRHLLRSVGGHLIWQSSSLDLPEMESWSPEPQLFSSLIWRKMPGRKPPANVASSYYSHRDTVAYGGLVPPLALLSAWLLLGKPRAKKIDQNAKNS